MVRICIGDVCGGVPSKIVSVGNDKLPIRTIDFPVDFLQSRANIALNSEEICEILSRLGFICKVEETSIDLLHNPSPRHFLAMRRNPLAQSVLPWIPAFAGMTEEKQGYARGSINITIPSWRYDVTICEDIVEEIVRIYGYDKLPENPLPFVGTSKTIPYEQRRISDIKRLLASCGYDEVVTWSFMDSRKAKLFTELKEELTLLNPISSDLDYMRPSILPNLLTAAHNNINRSLHDLSLFEVGPIFENADDQVINSVCGIRTGLTASKNSHEDSRSFDVFDIKADLTEILQYIGLDIDKCQIVNNAPAYYHPTRSASILLGKNILGYFGQVHPVVLKKFDIDSDVIGFELNIPNLPKSKEKYGKKPEFIVSNYQMITRDYAFIVDRDQPVGELLAFIKNMDKKRIRAVNLFDLYYGEKIANDKKSVALSVSIQDDNKTLEEADIAAINKAIIEGIEQKFGAILRDS